MKLTDIITYMPALYFTSVEDHAAALCLKGDPGGGKTWTISQFPQIMKKHFPRSNYGFRAIEGATLTHSNALGYMWPEDGKYGKRAIFTDPYWKYTKEGKHLSEYDGGILLIDDYHLIDVEIKKILSQGAYEGVFANHKLDKGWVMWFSGNWAHNRSGATKDFDHLITRQMVVGIENDPEGCSQWYRDNGALPETITFSERYALQCVFMSPPKEQGPYCNPRTLFQADKFLRNLKEIFDMDKLPTDPIVQEFIAGSIGKGAAATFMNHIIEANELPDHYEIINNPSNVRMPPKERPDLWRLQAYKLARDVMIPEADAAITYMNRFPVEFQTIFVRAAMKNSSKILFTPKMKEWTKNNMVLVSIITNLEER